jgi:hypothetical protein
MPTFFSPRFCFVLSHFRNDFQRLGVASGNSVMKHGIFLESRSSEHDDVIIGDRLFALYHSAHKLAHLHVQYF